MIPLVGQVQIHIMSVSHETNDDETGDLKKQSDCSEIGTKFSISSGHVLLHIKHISNLFPYQLFFGIKTSENSQSQHKEILFEAMQFFRSGHFQFEKHRSLDLAVI